MADQVYIEDIAKHTGREVTIKGWLGGQDGQGTAA